MQCLLLNRFKYTCLTLLITGSLAEAVTPGHEQTLPAPCDQLEETLYRERCARFLADGATTGCQTFSNTTTVASYNELKTALGQDKYGNGLILLVAGDIDIIDQASPMEASGVVALVGDPDKLPKISSVGAGETPEVISALNRDTPGALFCWGIEWVLDTPKSIVRVFPHFGRVHITHSIFRVNRNAIIPEHLNAHDYLRIVLGETVGRIKSTLLIAHNQFHGVPSAFLGKFLTADIFIRCDHHTAIDVKTCHEPGEVVIRDNTWHGYNPYPDSVNYGAIKTTNIPGIIISGNRAVDDQAMLSVYMEFRHPVNGDGTPFFDNLDLQLLNNTALPGMNLTQRQVYINGEDINGDDYPLAGVVNMTCNPYFDVIRTGSFAKTDNYSLAITRGNNYCAGFADGYFENSTPCEVIPVNTMDEGDMKDIEDMDDLHRCGDSGKYFISTYSLGVSTATLAAVSWGLFWSLVYHHTRGRVRTVVNALALFIPGCFCRLPLEENHDSLELPYFPE